MMIRWEQMMAEFDRMNEFDQLRAANKAQLEWLTGVARMVPVK